MTYISERNTICPACGRPMITLHASHLHCDNCGSEISEEDT